MAIRVAPRSWFNERKRETFVSFVISVFIKKKRETDLSDLSEKNLLVLIYWINLLLIYFPTNSLLL